MSGTSDLAATVHEVPFPLREGMVRGRACGNIHGPWPGRGADPATVSRGGGETRVLPRSESRSGTVFTDGKAGLKFAGDAPDPLNAPRWIQGGQLSSLTRCTEAAG